jgi:uncharacterized protein
MAKEFTHEPDARRYVMRIDGQLVAVVDYAANADSVSLTRTFTSPPFRGKGYAGEVVTFAIDDIESTTHKKIVPMCWYVGDWFQSHPERVGLLTRA